MAGKQYGISAEEVAVLKEEAAIRLKNREIFLKETHSPYRHAIQKSGCMMDPAIMRYEAATHFQIEYFKPTLKTSLIGFVITFGLIGGYAYLLHSERESRFKEIRNGRVAYKDREYKII